MYLRFIVCFCFVSMSSTAFAATPDQIGTLFWHSLPPAPAIDGTDKVDPTQKFVSPPLVKDDALKPVVTIKYAGDNNSVRVDISENPTVAEYLLMNFDMQHKADVMKAYSYSRIKISGKYDAGMTIPTNETNFVRFFYIPVPDQFGKMKYVLTMRLEGSSGAGKASYEKWMNAVLLDIPFAALAQLK
ncbi:MAG: hypothetical protein HY308_03355 [Gammaproteobacteria bacterium]|nr:hypothetical protein [Gammaproteobacteria bacterium]